MAFQPPLPLRPPLSPRPTPRRTIRAAVEPSLPLPPDSTSGTIPPTLSNTTIYHTIPSQPPHLSAPSHPSDNDGYIVALSLTPTPWLRARHIRTTAFNRERRTGRVYGGEHGTPSKGPSKPKPLTTGLAIWQNRLFAFGTRSLPNLLDAQTLVTKRPTALGSALSDSNDLCAVRGAELFANPIQRDERMVLPGLGRSAAGRITGAFFTEIDGEFGVKRMERVALRGFHPVDFGATDRFLIVVCQMRKAARFAIFGQPPGVNVDVRESLIVVVPRDGGPASYLKVDGVMNCVCNVHEVADGVVVEMLEVTGLDGKVPLAVLKDVSSGRVWVDGDGKEDRVRVVLQRLTIAVGKEMKVLDKETVSMGASVSPVMLAQNDDGSQVYTIYDHSVGRSGLFLGGEQGGTFLCEEGELFTGPVLSPDGGYVNVLCSSDSLANLLTFDVSDVGKGPIHCVSLKDAELGCLHVSLGGTWTNFGDEWSEEGAKIVKSAFEIFDERNWNDIDSSFSSLGLGQ